MPFELRQEMAQPLVDSRAISSPFDLKIDGLRPVFSPNLEEAQRRIAVELRQQGKLALGSTLTLDRVSSLREYLH